ncbi:c-type cytochrome [Pedobacter aquatilis]|uniref:c-type cytochrome n=1 Tax=Pedobacter aquatilis TaxID=351343 RepID=UPI002930AA5A|nr:c-type cytochrome [Pedobacter aquatilis]
MIEEFIRQIRFSLLVLLVLTVVLAGLVFTMVMLRFYPEPALISETKKDRNPKTAVKKEVVEAVFWQAPSIDDLPDNQDKQMISYGKDLIASTSKYLGPEGIVGRLTNGMNCQNCHLEAGTKVFGNNYSAVYSTYPKFRARSGTKETIVKRISDCFERSLNGSAPDSNSKEMKAMIAYMKFLGTGTGKGTTPKGAGIEKLTYLDRAANPKNGALLYQGKCSSCHGNTGAGIMDASNQSFVYPPLWGEKSYNDAAGLYRISNFAGYVKSNMPFGASSEKPLLTDEEAWDIAAFVNSQPRPHKDQHADWTDISKKPIDFPFGPYSDQFSEVQHKYGPFNPIKEMHKNTK